MVIQPNMNPKAIIEVWEETKEVFNEFNFPISEMTIETIVEGEVLDSLLRKLNEKVGSSSNTCTAGG